MKLQYKILLSFALFVGSLFGQNGQSSYLVDNLNYEKLPSREKHLIDSALILYRKSKDDTARFNALNIIIEESWNEDVWPRYNDFLLEELRIIIPDDKENDFDISTEYNLRCLTIKANAINNAGYYEMKNTNYDESFILYERSQILARKCNDSSLIAVCYNNIGHILNMRGNNLQAIDYYNRSAEIRSKIGNERSMATVYNNIGIIYGALGYRDKALEFYFKSLEIMKNYDDHPDLAVLYSNIGDVFMAENDVDKALDYFLLAKTKHSELEELKGLALTMARIADAYIEKKDFKQAAKMLKEAEEIQREKNDRQGLARTQISLAKLNFSQRKFREAASFVSKGIEYFELAKLNFELGNAYNLQSEIFGKLGKWNDAFESAKKAMSISNKSESSREKYRALMLMAQSQSEMGDIDAAYKYTFEANRLLEQIQLDENKKKISEYKSKVDIEVRDREIDLLNEKNEYLRQEAELDKEKLRLSSRNSIIFAVGIVALIALLIFIFRNFKKQKELNSLLKSQKDDALELNHERETMLKEIHHRVKNNLQVVSSMLRLQSSEIEDESTQEIFDSAQNRIYAMALIHEKMYGVKDLKQINTKEYIEDLVRNIQSSDGKFERVKIICEIDELTLPIEEVIPIGLIINELMSNSMKHAFSGIDNPIISLNLTKNGSCFTLRYTDNGIGDNSTRKGLGKDLINSFVEQIDGEMKRLDLSGTAYEIVCKS